MAFVRLSTLVGSLVVARFKVVDGAFVILLSLALIADPVNLTEIGLFIDGSVLGFPELSF